MRPVEEEGVGLGGRAARVVLALRQAAQGIRTAGPARAGAGHRRVAARRGAQVGLGRGPEESDQTFRVKCCKSGPKEAVT